MNAHRFRRICNVNYLSLNKFRSAHAERAEIEFLPKQDAQISRSSNGITVASVENHSPLTKVSMVIKAGSRYEAVENKGIVHLLRSAAALSTKNQSPFSLTRRLEMDGIKLGVTSTRDNLIYEMQCARDSVDSGLEVLSDIINNPAFKAWEVIDVSQRLHIDIAMHNKNPHAVIHEALHKAAFRGGLSNSLYCQPYMVGKHTVDMLYSYLNERFIGSSTSFVGLGMPHEHLQSIVDELFQLNEMPSGSLTDGSAKFGSGEVRLDSDTPFVHSAIVAEGAGLANTKDVLSLGVLQCILGLGSHIDFSDSRFSKLGEAAAKSTNNPFYVSGLNFSYSDTGVFGVYIVGLPNDMKQLVKAVVSEMRAVSKSISDQTVEMAKHKLKAKLMLDRETSTGTVSAMALEVAQFGKIQNLKEIVKSIDELKTSDVASMAAKVLKGKPAMASLGQLHSTPHVDELL